MADTCKKHPKYKGKLKPRAKCDKCWEIYEQKNKNEKA
jgi:hypothetical protein